MAHGENAQKFNRGDYWTKRPGNQFGAPRTPYSKLRTHRMERQQGKQETEELLEEYLEERKGNHGSTKQAA